MATKAKKKSAKKSSMSSVFSQGQGENYEDGNCGDDIASILAKTIKNEDGSTNEKAMAKVAKDNGIDMSKYVSHNIGMQRMNVGNRLRGLIGAGTNVIVGGKTFKGNTDAKKKAKEKAERKSEREDKAKAKANKSKAKEKAKKKSPKK